MQSVSYGIVGKMKIIMDGIVLKDVEGFKYLGSLVTEVGGVEAEA